MAQVASEVAQVSLDLSGLVAGTEVMTADGALPIEFLNTGDRIVTRCGLRVLRAVSVQLVRRAAMVRIGADTLGLGRPEFETLVAAGQCVLVRDWRAQALYGKSQAMIPAARLVDGTLIRAESKTNIRVYTLHFDALEVVYAGGLELACQPELVAC